jgi:hypothetical protein
MTPNVFAYSALLAWPIVSYFLYRNLSVTNATIWTILGAQLLLPVGPLVKIPMVPLFDKTSVPNLCVLIGCMATKRSIINLRFRAVDALLVANLIAPLFSSMLNGDVLWLGGTRLPGVGLYDAFSAIAAEAIFLIPLIVGRWFLGDPEDVSAILRALVIAGLVYSVPLLFEIRMSPQLHFWVYGYVPSDDFVQQIRGEGFRPMVFMGHGLVAAFFAMTSAIAAIVLWRRRTPAVLGLPSSGAAIYLLAILLLCKSLAANVYAMVAAPLVRWSTPKFQVNVAVVLVVFVVAFPLLRYSKLVPTASIVAIATMVDEGRAQSLAQRFNNEDRLLERASQRWLFGWGRWGRNRVYDLDTGQDISVTDGRWIITFGVFGMFGFLAEFGLLAIAIARARSALKRSASASEALGIAALALIMALNMIELLPNSTVTAWTMLVSGALIGQAEAKRRLKTVAPISDVVWRHG